MVTWRPAKGDPLRRLYLGGLALLGVLLFGTVGYRQFGLSWLDALYMTVISVTTVGYREVGTFSAGEQVFTMALLLVGVGVVLYTLTALLQSLMEGELGNAWGRRSMQHEIDAMHDHAIIVGYGRVGRAAAHQLRRSGVEVAVIDVDASRVSDCPYPTIVGDASADTVLRRAGLDRARLLVSATATDAESVYVVLTARSLRPDVRIIARARTDAAESKFLRAGADRVVNPQRIGGNRIATFALSPNVVDFLDVVMHDSGHEFVLEDVVVRAGSDLADAPLSAHTSRADVALVLALRTTSGGFTTNPSPDTVVLPDDIVIAVGTSTQIDDLRKRAGETP